MKVLFRSSNLIWGGSEVLWYKSAMILNAEKFDVSFIGDVKVEQQEYIKKLKTS
jgi:hypothetical protein